MPISIKIKTILFSVLFAIISVQASNLVHIFERQQAQAIFKERQQTLFLVLGDLDQNSAIFEVFSILPAKYPNIMFTYTKVGEEPYSKFIQLVGVQKSKMPVIIYFTPSGNKYLYEPSVFGDMTSKNIAKFLTNADRGDIPVHLRSGQSLQGIKDQQRADNQKYLKYLTAYTLNELRETSQKQLIVVVYAYWCQYSQKFAPTFKNVAKRLSSNSNLIFGKLQGPSNQIKGYEPVGYPQILFWGSNRKGAPSIYYGQRSQGDVIAWIKRKTEKEWVEPLQSEIKIQKVEKQHKQTKQVEQVEQKEKEKGVDQSEQL